MDLARAGAVPAGIGIQNLAHGLSLTVMKKGMDTQEQLASQMLEKMMPPSPPGKGEFVDFYA